MAGAYPRAKGINQHLKDVPEGLAGRTSSSGAFRHRFSATPSQAHRDIALDPYQRHRGGDEQIETLPAEGYDDAADFLEQRADAAFQTTPSGT